jgi:hypothetical protein
MRRAGFEPLEPYPGAQTPWQCRCIVCGRESTPRLNKVLQGGRCKWCAVAQRSRSQDSAVAVMRDAGFEPLEPYQNRHAAWRCRCTVCGRESAPRLAGVLSGKRCRWCAHAAGGKARRTDSAKAAAVMRVAGLEPLVEYPGARTPWPCRCILCGKESSPQFTNVLTKGSGCRYCAGKAVDAEDAVETMKAAGFEPLEDYPGSDQPWRCRCERCGRQSLPRYITCPPRRFRSSTPACPVHCPTRCGTAWWCRTQSAQVVAAAGR